MITKNFFVCGLTGWCMEILFTSTGSFLKQDKRLIGRTSVWMFPIYGTAAVIAPLYHSIKKEPVEVKRISMQPVKIAGFPSHVNKV